MSLPVCGTCKWFVKMEDVELRLAGVGACHGGTPTVIPLGMNSRKELITQSLMPTVNDKTVSCRLYESAIVQ